MNKNYFGPGAIYNDNHRDITINTSSSVSDILKAVMAEDVEPEQEPKQQEMTAAMFCHLTQKCIDEKRVEAVEAEIRAACKGTAEGLWRTLWNNENLGYVETQHLDASTLFRDIESRFGKLPYKERQFRSARNNR